MGEVEGVQVYQEIMHNLDEIVLFVDAGNRILHGNVAAREALYYENEELAGRPINEIIHNNEEHHHRYQWQGNIYRKNGTCFFAEFKRITVAAGEIETIYLIRNLEKEKKQEEEIKKLQQAMKELTQARQSFLANVTHELRTPINGMKGMAVLLKESGVLQEQQDSIDVMLSCCSNMERIVNDILDYSKLGNGKLELVEEPFSIREWLQGIMSIQESVIRQKNLACSYMVDPAVPQTVVGDGYHLGQVLGNLLNNAVKFTKEGKIIVEMLLKEKKEHQVVLSVAVSDTGIGIAEEKLEGLFESFQQVDPTITREYGGTGLGLAIAKELVTMMHGEIGVESKSGIGSRFYFTVVLGYVEEEGKESVEELVGTIEKEAVPERLQKLSVCMEFESFEKAEQIVHQLKELWKDDKPLWSKQAFRLELALRKQKQEQIVERYEKLVAMVQQQSIEEKVR